MVVSLFWSCLPEPKTLNLAGTYSAHVHIEEARRVIRRINGTLGETAEYSVYSSSLGMPPSVCGHSSQSQPSDNAKAFYSKPSMNAGYSVDQFTSSTYWPYS